MPFELGPEEILESIDQGVYTVDREWRITYVNGLAAERWHCSPGELVGKNVFEAFPQLRRSEVFSAYQQALASGQPVSVECPGVVRRSWVAVTVRPYAWGLMVLFRDLAASHRLASDLSESQERLRLIAALCREGIVIHNESRILEINDGFLKLFGYRYDEALRLPSLSFVTPEARGEVAERVRSGYEAPYEVTALRQDGAMFPVEVHSRPCRFRGEPATVTTIWDLSAARQAEQERTRLLTQMDAVLEQLPAGVLITDAAGAITRANRYALRLLGGSVPHFHAIEDAGTWGLTRLDGTRYLPEELPLARAFQTGLPVVGEEMRVPLQDGSWLYVSVDAAPVRNAEGATVAGVITFYDLSERKQVEQLALGIREAHHRIKNNLQAITDVLSLELLSAPDAAAAGPLQASVERVQAIAVVHDLLSQENVTSVDLSELAGKLIPSILQANAKQGSLQVKVDLPPVELPSRTATALALILNEVISNAMKHAVGPGGGRLALRLTPGDERYCLIVRDDGPGLPPGFDLDRDANVGLQMVRSLTEDSLNGTLSLRNDGGLVVQIAFPR
ncbi:MAG: PAS domain S-box protein [Armatimonadota bacterium]